MPDFTARFTGGVTLSIWNDHEAEQKDSVDAQATTLATALIAAALAETPPRILTMPDALSVAYAQLRAQGIWAQPTRIQPIFNHAPPRFYKAAVGVPVTIKARVDLGGGAFVEGPADVDLGGRLFMSFFAERACAWPVLPTGTAGSSSIQTFTPPTIGHYLWVLRRRDGGGIGLPFDAE